ncbi:MAG TPA: hypothetical protein VGR57_18920 [Ktedonobacterales bacterium]|nr:hypothetical protein [Ktedonobacterales bacterium]
MTTEPDATAPAARPRKYHLSLDLWRGVFAGAYAIEDMRAPGLLAWIAVGFVPVIGSLAAVRDAYYSFEVREWSALVLNLLGILPFMKGVTNVLEVAHLHQLHRVAHVAHQVSHVARHGRQVGVAGRRVGRALAGTGHEAGSAVLLTSHEMPAQNRAAWPALLLSIFSAVVAPMLMAVVLAVAAGSVLLAHAIPLRVPFGASLIAVLLGVIALAVALQARRSARLLKGRPFSRGFVAGLALFLSCLGVLESVMALVFVLTSGHATL